MEDLFEKYKDHTVVFWHSDDDLVGNPPSPRLTIEELYQAFKERLQDELKVPLGLGYENLINTVGED